MTRDQAATDGEEGPGADAARSEGVWGALRRPHKKGTYRKPKQEFVCAHAVNMPLRTLAKRCKRFTSLLVAPAALLLTQG